MSRKQCHIYKQAQALAKVVGHACSSDGDWCAEKGSLLLPVALFKMDSFHEFCLSAQLMIGMPFTACRAGLMGWPPSTCASFQIWAT